MATDENLTINTPATLEDAARRLEPTRVPFSSPSHVALATSSTADELAIVQRLTSLINTAFVQDQEGIWKDGFERTDIHEVAQLLRGGELALAWRTPAPSIDVVNLIGCVRVHRISPRAGEFGLLVCDPAYRGMGIGRELVRVSEDHMRRQGAEVMQLDLLVPESWTHPAKARLDAWYTRIGYKLIYTDGFNARFGRAEALLAGPAVFRVYEKVL